MNAVGLRARLMVHVGLLLALFGGLGVSTHSAPPAVASPTTSSMSVYLDIPFVQGTYASSGTVVTQDFNSSTLGVTCPTIAGGTFSGTCKVESASEYGGATVSANVSTPTVGGSTTGQYASTSGTMTIDFDAPQQYLGLWWTAGSNGNTVRFFKNVADTTPLLSVTTEKIMTLLGNGPGWSGDTVAWAAANNDSPSNVVTSIDNTTTHRKVWYFGNPRGYSWSNPSDSSTLVRSTALRQGEPFVYLHMFAGGNLTFSKVELVGSGTSGFEFDNLAVSTTAQTPDPRLVLVSTFVREHTVSFEPNGSGVEGTMADQVRTTTGPLSTNSFERSGFTFAGWATQADGGGTRYADGAIYDLDADLTLFAQWTAIPNASSDAAAKPRTAAGSPPSSVADSTSATLAATGSDQSMLLGLSVLALVAGLALVAHSRRLGRRTAGGR